MHLLKYRDIYNKSPIVVPSFSWRNEVRGILRNPDGSIAQDTGWIKNTITDYGEEAIGTSWWGQSMAIGSGGGATNPASASLQSVLSHGGQGSFVNRSNAGSPTYVFEYTTTKRFAAGDGTGTVREVGMYPGSGNSTGVIACRAVVTDIPKSENQVLDMYYKAICTPDLTDKTGQVVIGGVTYNYTSRLYSAGTMTEAFKQFGPRLSSAFANYGNPNAQNAAVGDPYPSGGDGMTRTNSVVDGASQLWTWDTHAGLDECNFTLPGGIKSAYTRLNFGELSGTEGGIGVGLSAVDGPNIGEGIPKDNTKELTLSWSASWSR